MKIFMKRAAALALAASFIMSQAVTVTAASGDEGVVQIASKSADDYADINGNNILSKAKGEYVPMFNSATTLNTKYNQYWHDYVAAVAGASNADSNATAIKHMYDGQTYGDSAGSEIYTSFGGDIYKVVFGGDDGRSVTYTRSNGNIISHRYKYEKDVVATGNGISVNGFLFKTMDDIPDEYKYLFITHDTPGTTYHVEFRYAATEEEVLKLSEGRYKNWLASGISVNALSEVDDITIRKAIAQVVCDTLGETEETKKQREDLTGIWDYNFSNAEQGTSTLDNAKKFFKNTKDGSGIEYRDAFGDGHYDEVAKYKYFVYDATPDDPVKTGVYLRYYPGKGMSVSSYTISSGEGGSLIASLQSLGENDTSYTFRKTLAPGKVTIKKAKAKGKKINVSWGAVANADRYQIVVATDKKFKKITVDKTTAKTSISIKVKKKKTYFVKVRAYVEDALGENTCGAYSAVKKVKA